MTLLRVSLLGAVLGASPFLVFAGEAPGYPASTAPSPPAPAPDNAPAPIAQGYALRPLDVISLEIADDPKASHDYKISLDGTTLLTYLPKPVKQAGLTTQDAVELIGRLYMNEKIFSKPQISISVKEYAPRRINFLGQVNHPGWVAIPPEEQLTLVSAFSEAGGHTPKASRYCNIARKLADGTTKVFEHVDVRAAVEDARKDIPLQAGDTIFLGESFIGNDWQ